MVVMADSDILNDTGLLPQSLTYIYIVDGHCDCRRNSVADKSLIISNIRLYPAQKSMQDNMVKQLIHTALCATRNIRQPES